jgi:hypothetical protein
MDDKWKHFMYEIAYVDPEEMSQLKMYADREHLLDALDDIMFKRHGYQIKIRKKP